MWTTAWEWANILKQKHSTDLVNSKAQIPPESLISSQAQKLGSQESCSIKPSTPKLELPRKKQPYSYIFSVISVQKYSTVQVHYKKKYKWVCKKHFRFANIALLTNKENNRCRAVADSPRCPEHIHLLIKLRLLRLQSTATQNTDFV